MPGLIEEIQRDASDDNVSVAQLLRRMKIAASKLKLPNLEEWVEHELEGYPDKLDLPEYRALGGVPMAHSRFHGWRMMPLGPEEMMNKVFSFNFFRGSLAEVEVHAASTGSLIISFPEWLERMTLQQMNGVDKIGLSVDPGKFRALLSGVRNKALDWALAVEAAGVAGDGMTFSAEEAKAAQNVTNYYLTGDNARINQNSTDISTNTVVNGNLFGDLKARIEQGVSDEDERRQLVEAINDMQTQQGGPGFAAAYGKFIAGAANHMQIVQPFLEGLTNLLGG